MALYNYFVPATGQLGNFSLNSLPIGQSFVNIQDNSLSGFGFQNWAEINPYEFGGSPDILLSAKDKAAKEGKKWWESALNAVLIFGVPIIAGLVKAGILRNKNTSIPDLASGNFDQAAMQQYMQNGGLNTPDPKPRETQLFGIPVSTLIMVGAGLLIFMLMQPQPSGRKR